MKKAIALGLSAVMALSLAACGGSDSSSTPASGSTASGSTASTGDGIVYWSMWSETEPQAAVIKEAAAAYEEDTGVHVDIQFKGRDITNVIQAALDGGEQIDVFDDDFQRMSEQFGKSLMSLEDMAAAAGYEDFAVAALPAAVRGWAGELKAIAYQPYTSGVFFTQSSFDAAGITELPTTWDEFLDVCQKLKDAGYVALAQDDAYVQYTYGFMLARMIGQDAVEKLCTEGGWADSAEAKQAAQYIVDLRENGYLSSTTPDAYPNGENMLGLGEAAMVINASWTPSEVTNNMSEGGIELDETWGFFNFPSMTANDVDPNTVANIGAQAMGIPATSQHAQEAFDFIMYVTSGEYDQKMALETNSIPADTRNTEWPEMIANVREGFNAQTNAYEWNMGLNANQDIGESMKANLASLFEGGLDAQGFVDAMDSLY